MILLRSLVALLVVGVIAVATDAQVLACEWVCARPQVGVRLHQDGQRLGHHASSLHHEWHSEHRQPGATALHNHYGQAAPESGQVQQCVTVNDVWLQSGASRNAIAPLVAIDFANQFGLVSEIERSSLVAVAGSPPARNGPLQSSSILRI